ncbi:SCO family protein (plasmid) [Pedobacter sp. BS3]|uniref:SCO family protein n=1 Tax=Pedobacter sp. BS3 TaxID=2567937 RepID=UPI0011EFE998|nr:SCO family protein [Pedobacter sp. BS3]TZF85526.1 SCO family protein [Pedobacter sp. BS3]
MKIPIKKVLILVAILALPGFLYYLLKEKGKNRYKPLAIYGPKQVAKTFHTWHGKQIPDTIYHTISDFKLLNQDSIAVSFPADTNKIYVVNFFFTRCPSFCRNMNNEMQRVAERYKKNDFLRFLSITVDPDYDTPSVLKKYAAQFGASSGKWDFLTGNQQQIFGLAHDGFLVDALTHTLSASPNYIHSPMLILVDPHKRIRGYYDSNSKEQVDQLIDEIKVLIVEELRQIRAAEM